MATIDFNIEFGRIIQGLSISQKKGCFNLDEAAALHSSIIKIQQAKLTTQSQPTINTDLQNERDQLVAILEDYKNAIEEFKKQHDSNVFNLKVEREKNKELSMKVTSLERENIDLKNDLTELVNVEPDEEDLIPVVTKSETTKKKSSKR